MPSMLRDPDQIEARYDVVAFGSHPDDLEHAMGGTLIKMARDGVRILMAHATRGEGGTHGDPELRIREAVCAAKKIGADVCFLDWPDMAIRDTHELRREAVAVLRRARPHIVFAPYYDFPHMHPDHEELGKIIRGATRLVRIQAFLPEIERHHVRHWFYYILPDSVKPTMLIDVTDLIEDWKDMARCYASQLDGLTGYFELLMTRRANYGLQIGRPYAEAFYSDKPIDMTPINLNDLKRESFPTLHH